jgi:hypothetical protein
MNFALSGKLKSDSVAPMRIVKISGIALAASLAIPSAASACVLPPPPVRFPGETQADYSARSKIVYADTLDEDRRSLQARLFDQASSVVVARVAASTPIPIEGWGMPVTGHRIVAEPLSTLKGEPQSDPMTMADSSMSSCGLGGGGPATSEKAGALIIVFRNVLLGGRTANFGLPLAAAREPRLMEALNEAALALRSKSSSNGSHL